MTIKYHTMPDGTPLIQGSDEWFTARLGILTASEMKYIITPKKLEYAQNDREKSHLYELAAQRVNNYVESAYVGDDMIRGQDDESRARETYHRNYETVETCGFITNDKWGFTLGCSPDGLVGKHKGLECKSRRQKFQFETIVNKTVPDEYVIQVQTSLLVSERDIWEYASYCGGMHMITLEVQPDRIVQDAILKAAKIFHDKLDKLITTYKEVLADKTVRLIETERVIIQEIF